MRQIMPHRNNIVVGRRRCKTFLQPTGGRPLNSGHCGISVLTRLGRFGIKLIKYDKRLKRYSSDLWNNSH